MYALAGLLAVLFGVAAAYPKAFIAVVVLSAVGYLFWKALQNPWVALSIVVAQYPIMNTLRTIYSAHHIPVFAGGVRFFPDFLQYVIIGQLLLRAVRDPRYQLKIYGDDLPVVTYLIVGVYSVVVALQYTHPYGPINGWYLSMTPPLFYLVIRWLRPTREQGNRFLRWMMLCFWAVLIPSFAVYLTRPEWYMQLQDAEHGFFVPATMSHMTFWRIYPRMEGFLFEENHWGTLCELVAVLTIAQLSKPGKQVGRYVLILLCIAGIVCSLSRGAVLGLGVSAAVMFLWPGWHRKRMLLILAVLVTLGGAGLVVIRDSPLAVSLFQRLDTIGTKAASKGELGSDRFHQWRAGWKIFLETPSGKGLGTVGNGASLSKVTPFLVGDGEYFRVLAEQGVPGIIAFLYLIISIPWMLWRYRDSCEREQRPMAMGLFAFHIGYCIHGIGANTFDYYCICPVYFMLLGLHMSAVHRYLREQREHAAIHYAGCPPAAPSLPPVVPTAPSLPSAGGG